VEEPGDAPSYEHGGAWGVTDSAEVPAMGQTEAA
jgi:hypothetical protein